MTPDSMSHVFEALANPARRKILDVVKDRPGCSVNDVCDFFEISRIAVMKHLRILERAELIVSQKEGRTRQIYFNAVPIQMIHDRWTTDYSALWAAGMTRIKYRIESARQKPSAANSIEPPTQLQRKRHA